MINRSALVLCALFVTATSALAQNGRVLSPVSCRTEEDYRHRPSLENPKIFDMYQVAPALSINGSKLQVSARVYLSQCAQKGPSTYGWLLRNDLRPYVKAYVIGENRVGLGGRIWITNGFELNERTGDVSIRFDLEDALSSRQERDLRDGKDVKGVRVVFAISSGGTPAYGYGPNGQISPAGLDLRFSIVRRNGALVAVLEGR